jgi:Helix-turn-helix domain
MSVDTPEESDLAASQVRCYQDVRASAVRSCLRTVRKGMTMAALKKGVRITGAERTKLATDLRKQYDKGRSIRELASSSGRSYGFVHRVLAESGTTLRGRGGATRNKKKAK